MATPVIMPRQGQSVESCILVEWLAKVGDSVTEGAPLANIETDKAVFEVESPAAGTLLELFFEAGADIPVLTIIAAIGETGEDVAALRPSGDVTVPAELPAASPAAAPAPGAPATAPAPQAATRKGRGVSPRARRLATAKGVDVASVAGSGPHGRVIERDVAAAAVGMPHTTGAARDAIAAGMVAPTAGSGPGGLVRSIDLIAPAAALGMTPTTAEPVTIPMTGIRKIIAGKMHKSLSTTAQLTMQMSFNATGILAYRARIKANGEALGLPNITINDIIAYAVVRNLRRMPEINAHFLGDRTVRYPVVNLGVATDTPRGLMVPVLHGAERLSLSALSRTLKPILEDCQSGSINPDLLSGGTFTITNMGMLGIESFTPILNIPEVAILGVGGLTLKAIETANGIEHVKAINLSLTVDHQAVDGAPGARFLKALCQSLENFELTLAE